MLLAALGAALVTVTVALLSRRSNLGTGSLAALAAGAIVANIGLHIVPETIIGLSSSPGLLVVVALTAIAAPLVLFVACRDEGTDALFARQHLSSPTISAFASGATASVALVLHRFGEGLLLAVIVVGGEIWMMPVLVLLQVGHAACEGSVAAATTSVSGMSPRTSLAWIFAIGFAPVGGVLAYEVIGVNRVPTESFVVASSGFLLLIAVRALLFARVHLERRSVVAYFVAGFATVAVAVSST